MCRLWKDLICCSVYQRLSPFSLVPTWCPTRRLFKTYMIPLSEHRTSSHNDQESLHFVCTREIWPWSVLTKLSWQRWSYPDEEQSLNCCDYNFVYTLFPAHILHNMDIIIGLVLCTPQSRFVTLRWEYFIFLDNYSLLSIPTVFIITLGICWYTLVLFCNSEYLLSL